MSEDGIEIEEDIIIERHLELNALRWPTASIASGEDGESRNRAYLHLRGLSWTEAKREFPKLETGHLLCPRCEMDNDEGRDYCERCGAPLV